jgi:hypothetical protein
VLSQTTIKIVGSFCAGGRKALMNFLKKRTNQWIWFKILHALHKRIGWLKNQAMAQLKKKSSNDP